nr:hypothetical protein [Pseudidiomarina aquimaris]
MMQGVTHNLKTNGAVTNVQTPANFPEARTLAQIGLDLVSLPMGQQFVTHDDDPFIWRRLNTINSQLVVCQLLTTSDAVTV